MSVPVVEEEHEQGPSGSSTAVAWTEAKYQQLQAAFTMFDKDEDGYISWEELGQVLRQLGENNPTELELCMILGPAAYSRGHIDFDEFLSVMHSSVRMEEKLRTAFQRIDKDEYGFITAPEIAEMMMRRGETMSSEEIDMIIPEADVDGDRKVGFQDFKKMILYGTKN